MKKWQITLMAVIVVLSLATSYVLYYNHEENNNKTVYEYSVSIKTPANNQYWILVPVALNPDNTTSPIMDNITVTNGNASWNIIETPHGLALNISGKGNITLYGNMVGINVPYDTTSKYSRFPGNSVGLSMWVDVSNPGANMTVGKVYIFSSSASISLTLKLERGDIIHEINESILAVDWQLKEVKIKISTP